MARPKSALTASSSAADVKPLASTLPIALWWASAAAFKRFPSIALPITIALSMALRACEAEAPGSGLMSRSDVQSTPFKNGYDASESFLAASPILSPDGALAVGPADATWFFLTTSLKVISAEYALSASAPFTKDFKYAGTPGSVMADTEL